jgi:lysophospholipase L1-like esterase
VLPTGTTQLTAALAQNPTIVSVELGGNEVLNATSGLFAPGVTVVPFPFFAAPYNALLDALGSAQPKVVLVGLPNEAKNLPAIRRGDEIWANRAEFAALHVDVSNDCAQSPNYINVSQKSPGMVFTAAFTSTHGLPNPVYSCADIPGTLDYVLTPGDMTAINSLLAQMTAHIRAQATARGYAYFSLGALFDRSDLKGGAYSVVSQMTSKLPYGFFTSLDGVHPNALGHAVLAVAAAQAINNKYGNEGGRGNMARVLAASTEPSLADRVAEPLPAMALQQARAIAAENQNVRLEGCAMPRACPR